MKKKIKNEAGVTLVEMLAAVLVLVLLSLMVGTGMSMATHSYETIVAQSEVELLLSTAVDALADDLRYAWDVDDIPPDITGYDYGTKFTYSSDSYGEKTWLGVKGGKIIAKNDSREWQVLANNAGAYGKDEAYKEYKVDGMAITHNSDNTFTIHLKVTDGSGITASTPDSDWADIENSSGGVTVRCLNPPA